MVSSNKSFFLPKCPDVETPDHGSLLALLLLPAGGRLLCLRRKKRMVRRFRRVMITRALIAAIVLCAPLDERLAANEAGISAPE